MNIAKLLSKTQTDAQNDINTFNKWVDKQINTDQAIKQFKKNNHIDDEIEIDNGEFEYWLNSLGYFRGSRV